MSREIVEAMHALAREKGIADDKLLHALEDALLSAYKKQPGAAKYARVVHGPRHGRLPRHRADRPRALEAHLIVETIDEGTYIDPETGEPVEPQDPEIDPAKFDEYRDQIDERDVTPDDFGRIAAQTAKQVILQRIREAERDMMFEEYRDRVGELITGIVQQSDSRYTLVQLRERVEALLPKSEQVDGERYDHSQRIKAVIKEVSPSTKGPSIIVSRRDPELIKKLFELEVPEIADGLVEIANVAREPGYRSKIAVVSHTDGVDPVGACVGPRGSRVRMVVSELRGEKIDIIPYNDEPARFVAKALSPARVREVLVDDEGRQATVDRPRRPALAGDRPRGPERASRRPPHRLAHRHQVRDRVRHRGAGRELPARRRPSGRCAAILGNGRRCPNASLPGSRYCGLDAHQALEGSGSDYVAGAPPRGDRRRRARRGGDAGRRHPERRTAARSSPRPRRPSPTRSPPTSPCPSPPRSAPHSGARARPRTPLHRLRPHRAQGAPPPTRRSRRPRRRRSRRDRCRVAARTSAARRASIGQFAAAPSDAPSAVPFPSRKTS